MQRLAVIIGILLLAALVVLGLNAVCGGEENALQCVRDIAVVVLVIETFVVTLLMALIVLIFGRLLSTIQHEVLPILDSAKRTVDTVQGTTTFVSDTLVSPLISLAGFGSAIKGIVGALFKRRQRRS